MEDNASQSELQQLVDWSDRTKREKLSMVPNKHARNLISLLLCKDPAARLTPKYVLSHPFLTGSNPSRLQGEQAKYDVFLSYRVDSDSDHVVMLYEALCARELTTESVFFPGSRGKKGSAKVSSTRPPSSACCPGEPSTTPRNRGSVSRR